VELEALVELCAGARNRLSLDIFFQTAGWLEGFGFLTRRN
jgi:hypothetical protein